MKLTAWLETVGDKEAARILKITPRAARSWRTGQRTPRPTDAIEIVKKLKGKVTFPEIYG